VVSPPQLHHAQGHDPRGTSGRRTPHTCSDFVVELRGFEPMAIAGAARSRGGSPLFARPLKAALGGGLSFRLATSRFRGRGKDLRRDLSLGSRRRKEPDASAENTGVPSVIRRGVRTADRRGNALNCLRKEGSNSEADSQINKSSSAGEPGDDPEFGPRRVSRTRETACA